MIDPKLIELMNRVLDGAATEPERADLDRALTASPEARDHYDELRRLVRRLESVPMVDPPAHLHPRVMDSVDASGIRYTPRASDERGFFSWLRAIGTRRGLGYASTFGLGLAAGAVVLAVVRPIPVVDPGQVSGAITTPHQLEGVLPVAVPEAGIHGSVHVFDRGSITEVHLKVDDRPGMEWVFDIPRAEPGPAVVLKVIQAGNTVFEGAVQPVDR